MKLATACERCRINKRKCWQTRIGDGCLQCRRNRAVCSLAALWTASVVSNPTATTDCPSKGSPSKGSPCVPVSDALAERLIGEYIRCVLDRPHSIFHLPSLHKAIQQKELGPALHCSLLSYGARFYPDPQVSSLSGELFQDAKNHLHQGLENVCIENIQACILLASLSAATLSPSSEALYLSVAIHMAEVLQLGSPQPTDSLVLQELKRRIWWSLYMADYWCSTGNGLQRKMAKFSAAIDLPMDESLFHSSALIPSGAQVPGLWAYMITLIEIFGETQSLNRKVVQGELIGEAVDDHVIDLADRLARWESSLPGHVRYNDVNLRHFCAKGLGGPFVALHQGFFQYSTLLYFQYLDINRVMTPKTKDFPSLCKKYALQHSNLLRATKEIGNCEVLYPGVAHSTVISSSVLLHTVLFGEDHEIGMAQDGLGYNFEVLEELSRYWPSIDRIIQRLIVFQRTCMNSDASYAYKFDKWMVTFLLEYHLPLDDKSVNHTDSMSSPTL